MDGLVGHNPTNYPQIRLPPGGSMIIWTLGFNSNRFTVVNFRDVLVLDR